MARAKASVLLLGDEASTSWLRMYFAQRGFHCSRAESIACRPRLGNYRLILNTKPRRIPHSSLLELETEGRNIFSALPVENGCWWLPIVREGCRCFGQPALRSREFGQILDEILGEVVGEVVVDAVALAMIAGN